MRQVFLFTNRIRFAQPGAKFCIDIGDAREPAGVDVIAWRNCCDAGEAGIFEPSCQDDVSVNPALSRCDLGKGHAHLESDACFFRQNPDRANSLHCSDDSVKNLTNLGRLGGKVWRESIPTAGV